MKKGYIKESLFSGRSARRASQNALYGGSSRVNAVGICGVGLIGGSLAARLRRKTPKTRIVAYDKAKVLKRALDERVIDAAVLSPEEMLGECDMIVLSAPPAVNMALVTRLSRVRVVSKSLILDTGSTQRAVASVAAGLTWRNSATFIAGHPMAGREISGLDNRLASLFEGHPFFFDGSVALSARDRGKVDWFVKKLGAFPLYVDSLRHDRVMADVSHLPQLVSTVIASLVNKYDRDTLGLAGSGLQSMIRLGGSPFDIWRDVFADNSDNVRESLDRLIDRLQDARDALDSGAIKSAAKPWFAQAKRSYKCLW